MTLFQRLYLSTSPDVAASTQMSNSALRNAKGLQLTLTLTKMCL